VAIYLTLALTFFNFVGANAARVLLTLYALELDAPASAVGILGGLMYLFPLLLSWPVGVLADRMGARRLLLFAGFCGAISLVVPFFFRSLPAFYIAATLNGLALAFFHVTLQNLIGTLSAPEKRARNFSNFSLAGALTNFAGPLLAGFSIDTVGHAWACLVVSVPSMLGVFSLIFWGRLFPPGKPHAALEAASSRALADREVWRMLIVSGMVQLGTDLFQFYIPIYGHSIELSASAIGGILAMVAVAAFAVRLFIPALLNRVSGEKLLAHVFFMGAVGFALVPFAKDALVLGAIAFLFGLGMGIGIPLTVILMFSRAAGGRSGQTLGLRLTANNFVRVTGPMVFGVVASAFGLPVVFWLLAAVMASGGLVSRSRVTDKGA
jgi:predicted MFS family arabinose efflux permease